MTKTREELEEEFDRRFDESIEAEAEAMEYLSTLPIPPGLPPGFVDWILSIATDFEPE